MISTGQSVNPCYNFVPMATLWQQSRQTVIGFTISIFCLAAILFVIDPREIWLSLQTVQYRYTLLMVVGLIIFLALRAVRWWYMLPKGTEGTAVFHIQNVGYMFNMTLPLRIGDMARAVLIGNVPPASVASGISTMVVERLFDMLFVVTLLPFTLSAVPVLPNWMQEGARFFGYASLGGIVLLIIAANQRRLAQHIARWCLKKVPFLDNESWLQRLDDFLVGLSILQNLRTSVILVTLSFIVWLPVVYTYYVGLLSVGVQPTFEQVGFVFCAAALSVAIPSAPGSIGVFHLGVSAAMLAIGQNEGDAGTLSFLYHAVNLVTMVGMGLVGLSRIGATFQQVIDSSRKLLQRER